MSAAKGIDDYDLGTSAYQLLKIGIYIGITPVKMADVNQANPFVRLPGKVQPQVAFIHRGDGMFAHDRVSIQAISLLFKGSKMISEHHKSLELWCPHCYRHNRGLEDIHTDLCCPANTADIGG